MRAIGLALLMIGAASCAEAADMPDLPVLRGSFVDGLSSSRTNWRGFYIGAQAGTGTADMNFNGATKALAQKLLVNTAMEAAGDVSSWPVGGKASVHGNGIGGFLGYNSQWDDVVLGVELSYLHGKFGGSQSDSMERFFTDANGYTDDVTYQSTSSIKISDMATLRGRAGYAVGSFLPYVFGGAAFGRADIVNTAHIFGTQTNVNAAPGFQFVPFDLIGTDAKNSHFVYGYTGGLGMDINLIGGLFMRAEWEYVRFTAAVDTSINTVRAGLGYKF